MSVEDQLIDAASSSIGATTGRMRRLVNRDITRRGFISSGLATASGVAGLGVLLAACGNSAPSAAPPNYSTGDTQWARLMAEVEQNLIVAYTDLQTKATSGGFGTILSPVKTFVATLIQHHTAHRDSWNAVLQSSGGLAASVPTGNAAPDTTYASQYQAQLGSVSTLQQAATVLVELETASAATAIEAASLFSLQQLRTTAASIAPIEMQHVAVLQMMLGQNLGAAPFMSTSSARSTQDLS